MRLTCFCLVLLTSVMTIPAEADDFASDFASCAAAPIEATKFALGPAQKAARFLAEHGSCVPPVVAGDVPLIGMSGGVAGLMAHGDLPSGAQACVDASIGGASRAVAGAINKVPGLGSLLPADGRQLLTDIELGSSHATLYDVPGIGIIMDHVSCSCAIASTGLDAAELKENLEGVMKKVGSCGQVAKKILAGAYAAGAAVVGALGNAAKGAINSVGCKLHLGGCSSNGPPFFCVGYNSMRNGGSRPADIANIFPTIFPSDLINGEVNRCESAWLSDRAEAARKQKEAEENAKADKLGSANALGFAFRWIWKCSDQVCDAGIKTMSEQYNTEIHDPATISHYGSFNVAKVQLDKKYGARAELAILLSKDRHDKALRADANAPVAERLPAFKCNSYLGRPLQSLCAKADGFQVCKDYVLKGAWDMCALEGKPGAYAAGAGLERVLRGGGCIPDSEALRARVAGARPPVGASTGLTAQCLSPHARTQCDALVAGHSAVVCQGPEILALNRNAPYTRPRPMEPAAPPAPQVTPMRPLQPMQPIRPMQPRPAPIAPTPAPVAETSTLCRFTAGRRAGETQDYAPMAPIPVGSFCQDGQGSTGVVVAR
jgi:hypothetical protein